MTEWKKCDIQKPNDKQEVLAFSKDNGIYKSIFSDNKFGGTFYSVCINSWDLWCPTHWAELPVPPVEP